MLSHAVVSLLIAFTMLARGGARHDARPARRDQHRSASGLLNRRGFERAAGEALSRQAKQKLPAALVIADLDHFKAVNDRFGHASATGSSSPLPNCCGGPPTGNGIAGRLGGEEFVVLLTASDLPAARLFAEGARLSLSQASIRDVPERAESHGKLWRRRAAPARTTCPNCCSRADSALYNAKRGGRDCVRLSYQRQPEQPSSGDNAIAAHRVRSPAEAEAPSPTLIHLPDARFTHSNWTWFAAWLRSHHNRAGESDHGAKI